MTLSQLTVLIVEDEQEVLREMLSCISERARRRKLHVDIQRATYLADARIKVKDPTHKPLVVSTDLGYARTYKGKIDPIAGAYLIYEILRSGPIKIIVYSGQPVSKSQEIMTLVAESKGARVPYISFLQKRRDTTHDVWAGTVLDALSAR